MPILDVAYFHGSIYLNERFSIVATHDGPGTKGQRFRGAEGEIGGAGRTKKGKRMEKVQYFQGIPG